VNTVDKPSYWSTLNPTQRQAILNRKAKRDKLVTKLKDRPCKDCGVRYPPFVMDFDHVAERGQKWKNVSQILSPKSVKKEVAKCDLVCANCHRFRTHNRIVAKKQNRRFEESDPIESMIQEYEFQRDMDMEPERPVFPLPPETAPPKEKGLCVCTHKRGVHAFDSNPRGSICFASPCQCQKFVLEPYKPKNPNPMAPRIHRP
jgi:hypothetical protein